MRLDSELFQNYGGKLALKPRAELKVEAFDQSNALAENIDQDPLPHAWNRVFQMFLFINSYIVYLFTCHSIFLAFLIPSTTHNHTDREEDSNRLHE
jgi:hypothetical protein